MPQVDLGKRRSIQLPSGKVGYRKRRPSVDIIDRKAALEWAEQHVPDAVKERVTREVVKTPLIEYLQAGNSIDPTAGIVAVPEADVLFIEPGTPVY
jgi:phage host-nuclease inhibitor protein Gam